MQPPLYKGHPSSKATFLLKWTVHTFNSTIPPLKNDNGQLINYRQMVYTKPHFLL